MRLLNFKIGSWAAALGAAALTLAPAAAAQELPQRLAPVGQAVGITVKTDGVMVSELSEFDKDGEKIAPAKDAGIAPGDVIKRIDGKEITCAADMMEALEDAGESVTVQLDRAGDQRQVTVRPFRDGEGAFLGVWVKDGLTGIGTVTYYDPDTGSFGALGHSIADSATGMTVPLRQGEIMSAQVTGVTKSKAGSPGQLGGTFDYKSELGRIGKNCRVGIFGTVTGDLGCGEVLPVAQGSQVKAGAAKIISDASGQRREYDIEITRVYRGSDDGRDMMLKVTDPELISLTGGIVQGMSGSPIIQDGKLVGAVTHVLINDPEKGYGVFIENMVKAS